MALEFLELLLSKKNNSRKTELLQLPSEAEREGPSRSGHGKRNEENRYNSPADRLGNSVLVIAFVNLNKGSAQRNKMVVMKGITVKASICDLCYTVDSLVDFILLKVGFHLSVTSRG